MTHPTSGSTLRPEGEPFVLTPGAGEATWFLGTLVTVKCGGAQSRGALTVIEQLLPPGFGPPPHIHQAEEEAFYVLEGGLMVMCDGREWRAAPGSFVWLPRGLPHGFTVDSAGPARMLQLTTPAGFERFAAEAGEPARAATLPPPAAPDVERLLASASRHGYTIVGGPPA